MKTRVWLYDLENISLNGTVDSNGDLLDENGSTVFVNGFEFVAVDLVEDSREDADKDGLMNQQELALGTNPWVKDSDADGLTDGE